MPRWLTWLLVAAGLMVASWAVLVVLAGRLPPGPLRELAGTGFVRTSSIYLISAYAPDDRSRGPGQSCAAPWAARARPTTTITEAVATGSTRPALASSDPAGPASRRSMRPRTWASSRPTPVRVAAMPIP